VPTREAPSNDRQRLEELVRDAGGVQGSIGIGSAASAPDR
jgi:hypothetical protein